MGTNVPSLTRSSARTEIRTWIAGLGFGLLGIATAPCQDAPKPPSTERVRALALAHLESVRELPWRLSYSMDETFERGEITSSCHIDVVMDGPPGTGDIRMFSSTEGGDDRLYVGCGTQSFEVSRAGRGWQAVIQNRSGKFDGELIGPVQRHFYPFGIQSIEEILSEGAGLKARREDGGFGLLRPSQPWLLDAVAEGRPVFGQIAHLLSFESCKEGLVLSRATNLGSLEVAATKTDSPKPYDLVPNETLIRDYPADAAFGVPVGATYEVRFSDYLTLGGMRIPMRMEFRSRESLTVHQIDPASVRILEERPESAFAFEVPELFGPKGHIVDKLRNTDTYYGYEHEGPEKALDKMIDLGGKLHEKREPSGMRVNLLILAGALAVAGAGMLAIMRFRGREVR